MTDSVKCYAGSSYPEHPLSFNWHNQRYEIQETLIRRREPHGLGFIVKTNCDPIWFELFYNLTTEDWQIHPRAIADTESRVSFSSTIKEHE